jgi:dihydrofolate synthase
VLSRALRAPKTQRFHTSVLTTYPIIIPSIPKENVHPANLKKKRRAEIFIREVERGDPSSIVKTAVRSLRRFREDFPDSLTKESQKEAQRRVVDWYKGFRDIKREEQSAIDNREQQRLAKVEAELKVKIVEDFRKRREMGAIDKLEDEDGEAGKNVSKPVQEIKPGLERITALLDRLDNPQDKLKVAHVAGTNGKGSVCAYLTSALKLSCLKVGQFTSPHIIDRWDCITVNNNPIAQDTFLAIENEILRINQENQIAASSFEILTACALVYFIHQEVDIAVIETGMGGLLDATNVFKSPLVTVITSISLDHTAQLGPTIEDIAKHKAGIIKPSCPVVTTDSQPSKVKDILMKTAQEKKAEISFATGIWRPGDVRYEVYNVRCRIKYDQRPPLHFIVVPGIPGKQQGSNVACAVKALEILGKHFPSINDEPVMNGIAAANIPGRMQWDLWIIPEGRISMLIDGAHNIASCAALAERTSLLRRRQRPIIWLLAFSQGRDYRELVGMLCRPTDTIACVEIQPVEGMEWVKSVSSKELFSAAEEVTGFEGKVMDFGTDLKTAVKWAIKETKIQEGAMVATGSLYLVGDLLRLKRDDPFFSYYRPG